MTAERIDVVVAVRNEEENIPIFIAGIRQLQVERRLGLHVVFVEDSSTDRTLELLRSYSHNDPRIDYYSLKGGGGQTAAIAFGMRQSKADAVVTMDVDGGHPIPTIAEMIDRFRAGADIVQATRESGEERRWYRKVGTRIFNILLFALTGIDTRRQNVYFRLMSKRAKEQFLGHRRWLYFLRTNFPRDAGLNVQYVGFQSRRRQHGTSKYSFLRLLRLAILAPLSAMSEMRILVILCALAIVSLGFVVTGRWAAGVVVAASAAMLGTAFASISRRNVLMKLVVRESSVLH